MQKVLEVARNSPGEIQDVNYRGLGEKDKCDFELLNLNENNQKDRLHFYHHNGTDVNPAGNLTAMEN